MQTTANQVLVIFDEATTGFAECEVIGRDAEDERLDEVEHGQAVVAVRAEAIGDVTQLAGELGDATERVAERRLGVRLGEGTREIEPGREGHALAERLARGVEDRQRAAGIAEDRENAG